jgi:hypothetical protein
MIAAMDPALALLAFGGLIALAVIGLVAIWTIAERERKREYDHGEWIVPPREMGEMLDQIDWPWRPR